MTSLHPHAFAPDEVERFREAIADRLGLYFDEGRREMLATLLHQRLCQTSLPSVDAYVLRLNDPTELGELACRLTTGETYLFRNRDHFEVLAGILQSAGRPIRILSAGCSSGEEAYTIAILSRELLGSAARAGVSIHAVDVNPAAIARGRRGRYSPWSLRETSDEVRQRWFRPVEREFQIDAEILGMVSFDEGNLADANASFWNGDRYDVIFCRNVLMYFAPATQRVVVARLARATAPGGHLFLGHAETLRGMAEGFQLQHTHETFYYRRDGLKAPSLSKGLAPDVGARLALVADPDWLAAITRATDRVTALEARGVRLPESDASVVDDESETDSAIRHALLLAEAGALPEAERLAAHILAGDERQAAAHYLVGLSREQAGDTAAAVLSYEEAIRLDPALAMPHLQLGRIARRRGDTLAARLLLSRALALLHRDDHARILLFSGGFSLEALARLCRSELLACGAP